MNKPEITAAAPVAVRITATAADWRNLSTLRANAAAAKKLADAAEAAMGIPTAEEIAAQAGLPEAHGSLRAVIVDGNGQPIGQLSVYYFPGAEMPAGYRRRLS